MKRKYVATKQHVEDQGRPPDDFLDELIEWGRDADQSIFAPNPVSDIYSSTKNVLGPWNGPLHRRAVMLEVLRVLGGFESSWDWNEGRDITNATSVTPYTIEAGLWQCSANAMFFGDDLKLLVDETVGTRDGDAFQVATKSDHPFATEFTARLLRWTTQHHGPVKRFEIHPWLRRDAVEEIQDLDPDLSRAEQLGARSDDNLELRRLRRLERRVRDFEEASGVKLNRDGKKIGYAVDFVLKGGLESARERLSGLLDRHREIIATIEAALAQSE